MLRVSCYASSGAKLCYRCDYPDWLVILLLVIISCVSVGVVAAYAWALHRRLTGLKQGLSTFAILTSHVQCLSILGTLPLQWPPAVRTALAVLGLDVLHIPAFSCLVSETEYNVAGDGQAWNYALIICYTTGGLLGVLLAAGVARRWWKGGADDTVRASPRGLLETSRAR